MKSRIAEPQVDWDQNGNPSSLHFDDPYFSRENGMEESRHVFLDGNQLQQCFAKLQPGQEFVVGETGFGTGLNFLLTWQLFKQYAHPQSKLVFISVEGFPMQPSQLARAHACWPGLEQLANQLRQNWPGQIPGFHPVEIENNILLLLLFDQAETALGELIHRADRRTANSLPRAVDAWFLDGFAPSRNQSMWSDTLFRQVALLSHSGTSLATYSVAGNVRRGLQAVGFECRRSPGFGRKREMLTATLVDGAIAVPKTPHSKIGKRHQVWHRQRGQQAATGAPVAILGGGIAGICLGIQLNRLGIAVHLYEQQTELASLTSGNPQAAVFARLSPDRGELEDFALTSLGYACRFYKTWWQAGHGQQCGVLQLPRNESETTRLQRLVEALPTDNGFLRWLAPEQATQIAGIPIDLQALLVRTAGWINATPLIATLRAHPGNLVISGETPSIEFVRNEQDSSWKLGSGSSQRQYGQLVCCTGHHDSPAEVASLAALDRYIRPVGGQLSLVGETPASASLGTILCQRHYLTPASRGTHSVGASYRLRDNQMDHRAGDDQANLQFLQTFPAFDEAELQGSRVGVRATTADYLPMVGSVPDLHELAQSHAYLARDARQLKDQPLSVHPGLFVLRGLGSRGFTYAPLCALHLARQLAGLHSPLPDHLQRAIHPARFAIRDIIRRPSDES